VTEIPAGSIDNLGAELERSRETSARLLRILGQRLGAARNVPAAASSTIQRAVQKRPATAIFFAAAAGFLLARLLRPKFARETRA
jgi:hypothetical protein